MKNNESSLTKTNPPELSDADCRRAFKNTQVCA